MAGGAPGGGAGDGRPLPRFMGPMPPPFIMGMFPPPPIPPRDFTGLSEEELARMEGEGRESIEARLRSLRQIELLINATTTVMAQYLSVAPPNNRQVSDSLNIHRIHSKFKKV